VVPVGDSVVARVKDLLSEPQWLKSFLAEMGRVTLAPSPCLALTHITFLGRRNHFLLFLIFFFFL